MTKFFLNANITEHSVRTECSVIMSYMSLMDTDQQEFTQLGTKERILRAAFELSANSSIKTVSLNDIAKKAGIAKPGIFRYYKSKDDLQETMKDRFFDDFCGFIQSLSEAGSEVEKSLKEREKKLIKWFILHNDYLLFFLNTLVGCEDFVALFITEMQKRGIGSNKDNSFPQKVACKKEAVSKLYLRTTEIFFLLARVFTLSKDPSLKVSEETFSCGLVDLLNDGWGDLEEISTERMAELDALCTVDTEHFPEENKMFLALSSLLENYALAEITVEKVATELGMAKSSLYSHYKNKEDMIKSLIEEELLRMLNTMNETVMKGKSFSEYIYLHMRSQMEYLTKREKLVPVCNRLSVQGFLPENFLENFYGNLKVEQQKLLETIYPFTKIGFPVDGTIIGGWFFSLSVSAFKLGDFFGFSSKEIMGVTSEYYSLMKSGIKSLTA